MTPLTLSVKMSAVDISPQYLDDLASEYYGTVLTPAGSGESPDLVVEFKDQTHGVFGTKISASDNLAAFQLALDSFLLPAT